ncbi:MAG: hypothetical protein V4561_06690 [Bacteroidota bacterium]
MPVAKGLGIGGIWKSSGPKPLPDRITNVEDNNKCSIVTVMPGLKMIANKKRSISAIVGVEASVRWS